MHLAKSIKENCGRILTALAILGVIGKIIGYKTLVLILFAINLIQPTQAKKPTTIQCLHNTPLYIRFRINYNWLSSGFGEKPRNGSQTNQRNHPVATTRNTATTKAYLGYENSHVPNQ